MKTKLGIVGCGFLGNIVADAWKKGLLPDYELVGVTSRTRASAEKTAANVGCAVCEDVDALLALEPEYIVEAARMTEGEGIQWDFLGWGAYKAATEAKAAGISNIRFLDKVPYVDVPKVICAHDVVLATRDARALPTYQALGVQAELIAE